MNQPQYDDTNRGGLWLQKPSVSGQVDVNGHKFYCTIARTGVERPSHNVFLVNAETREVCGGVLFKDEKGEARILNGSVTVEGTDWWVNVFKNKSEHPKAPQFDVKFQPKEIMGAEPQAWTPDQGDDIPF